MLEDVLLTFWMRFPFALLTVRFAVLLVSFTLHELAHGLTAALLGDPTPSESGRLTLNPFPHLESIGAITGLLLGFGWSRPMPIRPHRMRIPAWIGGPLAVLAGPLASMALALTGRGALQALGLAPRWPWGGWPTLADFLSVLMRFNLTLALLNTLPLFPLDAFTAIRFALPLRTAAWWERASGWTTALLGLGVALMFLLPASWLRALIGPLMAWGLKVLWRQ